MIGSFTPAAQSLPQWLLGTQGIKSKLTCLTIKWLICITFPEEVQALRSCNCSIPLFPWAPVVHFSKLHFGPCHLVFIRASLLHCPLNIQILPTPKTQVRLHSFNLLSQELSFFCFYFFLSFDLLRFYHTSLPFDGTLPVLVINFHRHFISSGRL